MPSPSPGQAALVDGRTRELHPLAFVNDEVGDARRLAAAGPDSVRIGSAASEGVLKGPDAGRYRILHLAAHAIADEIVPRRSAILLSPTEQDDGLLQVSEIANLSLNADLVVLSACRSHVGRLVRGEGLLSLSRAFMHAGASAVVATSWAVADRETAWLMRRFYSALRRGAAPDEALRDAQLAALRSAGARAAPATWAAFVVFGDARTPVLDPPAISRVQIAGIVLFVLLAVAAGRLAVTRSARARRVGAISPDDEAGSR